MIGGILITIVSYGLYLGLYTAYDKQTKKFAFQKNLVDVLNFTRGTNTFLVENNKVMALNGLTTLGLAFVPTWRSEMNTLLLATLVQTLLHVVLSILVEYGSTKLPHISVWFKNQGMVRNLKKVSVLLGVSANTVLLGYAFHYFDWVMTCFLGLTLGLAHFYFMEIDFKWVMQVRPYGWAPFFTTAAGLLFTVMFLAGF